MSRSRRLLSATVLPVLAARVLPFTYVRVVWELDCRRRTAGGQEPFVHLPWVRRLTEPQSQDAAWDIDRLEPEGSCRIGTHCQRLCYHHRLPTSKGRRGCVRERRMKGGVGGRDGKIGQKCETLFSKTAQKGSCEVGVSDIISVGIFFL